MRPQAVPLRHVQPRPAPLPSRAARPPRAAGWKRAAALPSAAASGAIVIAAIATAAAKIAAAATGATAAAMWPPRAAAAPNTGYGRRIARRGTHTPLRRPSPSTSSLSHPSKPSESLRSWTGGFVLFGPGVHGSFEFGWTLLRRRPQHARQHRWFSTCQPHAAPCDCYCELRLRATRRPQGVPCRPLCRARLRGDGFLGTPQANHLGHACCRAYPFVETPI